MKLMFEVQNVEMSFSVGSTNELGQTLDTLNRFTRGIDTITRGRVAGTSALVVPLLTQEILAAAVSVKLGDVMLKQPGVPRPAFDNTHLLVWDDTKKCYTVRQQ